MTGTMVVVMELVAAAVDEVEVEEGVEGETEVVEGVVDVEVVVEEAVVVILAEATWDMEETSHKIL